MGKRLCYILILLILVLSVSGVYDNASAVGASNPTWHYQRSGGKRLYGIYFFDRLRGWAAGDDGTILHTDDGGLHWYSQNSGVGTGYHLGILSFITSLKGWVSGSRGTILHTEDGGQTWERQVTNTANDIYGIFFLDENQGWAVGTGGLILHTTNGGANWYPQTSGTYNWLGRVQFINASKGWISGNSGTILYTIDGGVHWQPQTSGTTTQLNELFFTDQNLGWAVGTGGTILHTSDGGAHWNPQNSGTTTALFSVAFLNAWEGWVTGYGIILHTVDGGQTWTTELSPGFWVFKTQFVDRYNGWAAADNGTILYYGYGTSSAPALRLPFPHTANENGLNRIYSFFDHEYPLYRSEPLTANDTTLKFTGDRLLGTVSSCTGGISCYSGHDGYDFSYGIGYGTPVLAAHDGYAIGTQWSCSGGSPINVIAITQGRYQTIYLHLQADSYWQDLKDHPRNVQTGDRVGTVGNSGAPACSQGPHLHFGVYYDANNNGTFESNELIDPYGFDPTKSDPWVAYGGPSSTWLWEFSLPDQGNFIPGTQRYFATSNVNVNVPGNAVTNSAFMALTLASDPSVNLATGSSRVQSFAIANNISVGSAFQLTGVYSDGTPLTSFVMPVTITVAYSDSDVLYANEGTLGLNQWNGANASWTPLTTALDTTANRATATTGSSGLFSLRAQPLSPAPTLLSISPSSANNNVATTITVIGTNFISTPFMNLGIAALDVHYVSSSTLTATVPAGLAPSTYTLMLRNPDGQIASLPNAFTVKTPIYLPMIMR